MSTHTQPEAPRLEPMFSIEALCTYIGVTRRTLERWRAQGKFPRPDVCGPKTVRWRRSTIDCWLGDPGPPRSAA